jgi:hypothetical protein
VALGPFGPPPASVALATVAPQLPASVPFTVPPWQSGQPASPAAGGADGSQTHRVSRSWAVVTLPPIDPQVFDRQRRLVLRISGGLVGAIIVLAILAGRC